MAVLSARHLQKSYKKRQILKDVNIDVNSAEVVGLLGPNGAGKTTCFYMIVGLVGPDGGTIHINDRDITQAPMHERARAGLGYLAQEASVFRKLTVTQNILAILELRKDLNRR
ncbi:MAG: ATP-binding cassette domain-containing protein, partial [Thiolinea sp.]